MAPAYLLQLLGAITETKATSRQFVRLSLCHSLYGDKKKLPQNTFVNHAQSVDESVPSLISPCFCFSEDAEHDILSSRLDCFDVAAAPFVCTEAVCGSSSSFPLISRLK